MHSFFRHNFTLSLCYFNSFSMFLPTTPYFPPIIQLIIYSLLQPHLVQFHHHQFILILFYSLTLPINCANTHVICTTASCPNLWHIQFSSTPVSSFSLFNLSGVFDLELQTSYSTRNPT